MESIKRITTYQQISMDTSANWKTSLDTLFDENKISKFNNMLFYETDTGCLKLVNGDYDNSVVLNYSSGDFPISTIIFAGAIQNNVLTTTGYIPLINDNLYTISDYPELYAIISSWDIVETVNDNTQFKFNIPTDSVLRLITSSSSERQVGSYQKNAIINHTHESLVTSDTVSDDTTLEEYVIDTVSSTNKPTLTTSSQSRIGNVITSETINTATETRMDNVAVYAYIKAKNKVKVNIPSYEFVGDIRPIPFRINELPLGWYYCNGETVELASPQGIVLNMLPDSYKQDWGITIVENTITLPNLFYVDGRGYFIQMVDGVTRQVGTSQDDAMRPITGTSTALQGNSGGKCTSAGVATGAFKTNYVSGTRLLNYTAYTGNYYIDADTFDSSFLGENYNGEDTHPVNIGMTPAIYLGV